MLAAWPVVVDAFVRLAYAVVHAHLAGGPWAAHTLAADGEPRADQLWVRHALRGRPAGMQRALASF